MATYYASGIIPTGQEVNSFTLTLFYPNDFTFDNIANIASITTLKSNYEAVLNGDVTFNLTTVLTGTKVEITWVDPSPNPTTVTFYDNIIGSSFTFNFTEAELCTGCGSIEWAECQNDYTINLGLNSETQYIYTLTNSQTGIKYIQTSITDENGVTTWDTYLMPELYVSGNVFVLTATDGSEDVTFTYNGTEYSCMQITIVNQTNITD
jgi:hypothetical protein